ncbi:hemolysin family protein [Fulvivirga ulvae]|uniref:CNNM domain-containing protein n=1 Tax=Fulvivirga ulvae TaxID=2904245 RepID=UPI001F2F9C51|nr:hemolysin family protein [Fulvivirga ulvae]UII33870.1 hemolysin family protein [Fulvivirga ulvae]
MILLFLYLAIAILVSFLCSILEAVLLSITPSYIEALKDEGRHSLQKRLSALKENIDKPLAAILSFNTIAHTVGAAGVGAQAAEVFGNQYLGVVSAVLTLLILVFSEIIPKTLGATYWRSLGAFTAKTLNVLIWLMYPLVLLSKGITYLLSGNKEKVSISRAEVSAMADIGHKEGVFYEMESKMLKNMIRFRNIVVEDIMTPRTVMVMAQEEKTIADLYQDPEFKKFSRIPTYSKNRDDITGFVHKNDVLTEMAEDNHEMNLSEIKRDIIVVNKEMRLPFILDKFVESKEHIALATDKFGSISGLVTMEDVMETVLGMEIMDEYDSVEDMQAYARKKWRTRALKVGIISYEQNEEEDNSRDNVARYGITGGQPPLEEQSGDTISKEKNSE